jgi:predicted AlkP superfamily pyrophosphatase or phosphodiesterase
MVLCSAIVRWFTAVVPLNVAADPILPDFSGGAISNIIPYLLSPQAHQQGNAPDWIPAAAVGAKRAVVLIIDGLGWNQFQERTALAPTMANMSASRITSVAPTTTATALTSIATGLAPGEHGIVGYRMQIDSYVMNSLRWADEKGDLRRQFPPHDVQPFPPFLGSSVPVISKAELEGSGFTEAHLQGVRHHGWRVSSSIPVIIEELLDAGENFVYAYYDGIDKIAHERGFGAFYDAELRVVDALISDIISRLPSDTALYVTADHGQVHVNDNVVRLDNDVMNLVRTQSGEGRFRWLHARRGMEAQLLDVCTEKFSHCAWVRSQEQILDEQWFGPVVRPVVQRRLGEVALVPFEPVTFFDPADSGPFQLVCRHGSLTADEMYVPLLVHRS